MPAYDRGRNPPWCIRGSNIFSLTWLSVTERLCPGFQMLPSFKVKLEVITSIFCVCLYTSVCMPCINTHYLHMSECVFQLGWVVRCASLWFAWMSHGWKPRGPLWSSSHTTGLSMDFLNRIWESWNHYCGILLLSVYSKPFSLPLPADPNLKLDSRGRTKSC